MRRPNKYVNGTPKCCAYWFPPLAEAALAARILQSLIHLASTSATAVTLRFTAFAVQMGIGAWWAVLLLALAATRR